MEKLIKELLSCKFKDIDINGLYEELNATENLENLLLNYLKSCNHDRHRQKGS